MKINPQLSQDKGKKIRKIFYSDLPEFKEIIDNHIKFYDEVIPHIFFGEWVEELTKMLANPQSEKLYFSQLKKAANVLERLLASNDEYMYNLIYVSFLENLGPLESVYNKYKKYYGPLLLQLSEELEREWGKTH